MANQFYPLKIKQIVKDTPESVVLAFEVKDEWKPVFGYKPGQHLTLRAEIGGEDVRRSYSLCSAPQDAEWRVAVKMIEGGRFSTYANEVLRAGDTLEVMPPHGNFSVDYAPETGRTYAAFAAGSGITPIFSILKSHLAAEPQSTFKLFYTNQSTQSIMLHEEIEGLKNRYLDRLEVFYFLTQEERDIALFNGRLDGAKLDAIFAHILDLNGVDDYFICGPEEMIFMVRDYLAQHGVDSRKVHFELFNTVAVAKKPKPAVLDGRSSEVTVIEGGRTVRFQMPQGNESILDAALRKSSSLPFACKGGVCCTCKARLVEGQVHMEVNYALEQEQLDAGYILTCQATPLSEKVTVDFDQ